MLSLIGLAEVNMSYLAHSHRSVTLQWLDSLDNAVLNRSIGGHCSLLKIPRYKAKQIQY